jgi:hypothetical protein
LQHWAAWRIQQPMKVKSTTNGYYRFKNLIFGVKNSWFEEIEISFILWFCWHSCDMFMPMTSWRTLIFTSMMDVLPLLMNSHVENEVLWPILQSA